MPAPAQQVFFEDGSPVPPDQIASALRSGKAFVQQGKPVQMLTDAGTAVTVAPEELDRALAAGYQFEDPGATSERKTRLVRGTLGQQALTAAEGAARGATLGLSDVALTGALGDEYRQGALERKQVNPGVAGVGEVGGTLAAALATGGVAGTVGAPARGMAAAGRLAEGGIMSGLGRLGYTGRTLIGRTGARALALGGAGATEGAFFGAGQALSQAALEGAPITAEKVVASMGEGALLGGLTGGALGSAGELLPAAGRGLVRGGRRSLEAAGEASPGLAARARELADESALKAIGARGSDLRRLGRSAAKAEEEIGEIGQELLSYKFKSGPKKGERLFQFASKADDFVDDLAQARAETGAELGKLRRQVDTAAVETPELAPNVAGYLKRVDEEVLAPLRASNSPTVRAQADRVEQELSLLRERAEAPPVEVRLADGSTELRPRTPLSFEEVDQFRRDLRSVFQPPKPTGGGLPAPVPEHAQHLERAERILSDELDKSAEAALARMGKDPAEYGALKEQYRNITQAQSIADKAALQDLGNRAVSPSDYAMGMASGLGALMSGNVGAVALGAAGTVAHKLIRERGRSVVALLADRVARLDTQLEFAVPKLLTGSSTGLGTRAALPAAVSMTPQLEQMADAVREYQRDPYVAQQRLAAPVRAYAQDYPELAAAVQAQVEKTYGFLASKLPQPLTRAGTSLTPELERQRFQAGAISKFSRAVRGAFKPQEVVRDLARGRLDRDGLEAIKALYPEMFRQVRGRVIQELGTLKEPLPFQQRILLSLVFDFQGDKSLQADFGTALQSAHAAQQAAEAAGQSSSAAPAQLSDRLASSMATDTTRLSGGM